MSDDDVVRRVLARLARGDDTREMVGSAPPEETKPPFDETIERAVDATGDVEAAARFVETVGLDELQRAVDEADRSVSASAADGRRALGTLRDLRNAAAGDHFRPGHDTSLGRGDIGPSK